MAHLVGPNTFKRASQIQPSAFLSSVVFIVDFADEISLPGIVVRSEYSFFCLCSQRPNI